MGVGEITYTPNAAVDVVELRALLQQTSWAKDRRLEDIRRSLRSQPHVVATHGPKMIGSKCVRGPSVRGARRSARGGVLVQYGGEQAQR